VELLLDSLAEAFDLLRAGDPMVLAAAWRSLWISSCAVALAALVGLPIGTALARATFPGKRILVRLIRASMAIPTVFIGLVCFALFSRRGPLGPMELLYTPWGIVIGELLLALPIVIAITHAAVSSLDKRVAETAITLGAGVARRVRTYLSEARVGATVAILTAFTRCVTELGIAMMVGGNIKGRTRTLSTATALEASKGEFARGIAMGGLLLLIALCVVIVVSSINREEER
jgi:tungstate transport system permease protein